MKDDVETMKKRMKSILIAFMLLATLLLVTACVDNSTPYDHNDANGYTVSIKFDANGGLFHTNTSVIVDSYNISSMATNSQGNVELPLIAPDDEARDKNKFDVVRNDYFLAGWYTERIEEGTDSNGNPVYSYAGKWEFDKDMLEVDPNKTYTASEPVVTLYAAWVPMFQVNVYSLNDNTKVGTYSFNPDLVDEIKVPTRVDGAMEMYDFPKYDGYTFDQAFYDKAGTQKVEGTVNHPGKVNYETGTAENASLDLYVNWLEGEWFEISTADQLIEYASPNASYILTADLDFTDKIWPNALLYGNFSGTIEGNGHTISNVQLRQANGKRMYAGLFGRLTDTAKLKNVTFDNVTFTIQDGVRTIGSAFGLLAGAINENAVLEQVAVTNSTLKLDMQKLYFSTSEYDIGKFCGMGLRADMDFSGITLEVVGEGNYTATENGNVIEIREKD